MKRSFSEGDLSRPLSIRPSSDYEVPENEDDDYYLYISKMDVEYLAGYDRQFRVNYKGKECLVEFYDNPTHLEVIDRLKGHKEFTQVIDCQAVTPYGSVTKYGIITPLYEAEDPPKHEIPYYTKKLIQAVQKLRRRKVLVRSMAPEFIVCRDGEVIIFNFDDALDLKKVHDPAELEWDDDYTPQSHMMAGMMMQIDGVSDIHLVGGLPIKILESLISRKHMRAPVKTRSSVSSKRKDSTLCASYAAIILISVFLSKMRLSIRF